MYLCISKTKDNINNMGKISILKKIVYVRINVINNKIKLL